MASFSMKVSVAIYFEGVCPLKDYYSRICERILIINRREVLVKDDIQGLKVLWLKFSVALISTCYYEF